MLVIRAVQSEEATPPELASPIKTDKKKKKKLIFTLKRFRQPKPQPIPEEVTTESRTQEMCFLILSFLNRVHFHAVLYMQPYFPIIPPSSPALSLLSPL